MPVQGDDWADLVQTNVRGFGLDEIGVPLGDHSMSRAFDAYGKHVADLASGRIRRLETPWSTLNWACGGGITPKTLALVSSRTGIGKSWTALQCALWVAGFRDGEVVAGLPVYVINSEMPLEGIVGRPLALASRRPELTALRGVSDGDDGHAELAHCW